MVATAAADREEGVTVADDDGPVVTTDVVPPPEGGGGLKPNGLKNGFGEGAGAAIPPPPPLAGNKQKLSPGTQSSGSAGSQSAADSRQGFGVKLIE